jgi:hypothetical protein
MYNKYVTNFDAPDAYFDYASLFSDAQVKNVGNPGKKMKTVKEPSDRAMPEGDNPSF